MQTTTSHGRWLAVLLLVPVLFGCRGTPPIESERTAAKGTVTLDGKPLPGGSILLVSANDPVFRVSVRIKPDGTFSVEDAPVGPVIVSVETESLRDFGTPDNPIPKDYVPIPAKYADVKTSGLTATVARGEDAPPLVFELKSK
jgi:hypothetical protein